MAMAKRIEIEDDEPRTTKRRYDSPLRRKRAAETRERIVSAGAELLHGFPVWNWRALTVRAVARRAGVNERTVYRHFANERELRSAVLARQQQEAHVDIDSLSLDNIDAITGNIFDHVSTFPIEPRMVLDPTLREAGRRNRELLHDAVVRATEGWDDESRRQAAAMLDVLWSVTSYERLVADWELDPESAKRAVVWVIGLVQDAIRRREGPQR